jgi:limonene-1,2-epoxide hydrolase
MDMGVMSDNYRAHLDAWRRGDVETALSYIDDDILWYPNRSMRPVRGKGPMREFLAKFAAGMSDIFYEQSLMIEQGNLLFVEGTENYTKNGRKISVPYAGVVEWRNGRAVSWRDYFDLKSLERQLAG